MQIFEATDIALYCAQIHFQAFGQLCSGHVVACLQDLENREDAHDGVVHMES